MMDRYGALPHLVEIAALRGVGPTDCDDLKAALSQPRGERAPARDSPLLVAEHRGGVDHRIGSRRHLRDGRRRRADQFGDTWNAKRVDESKHLLDAVNAGHGGRAAVKHAALDQVAEPGPVCVNQASMNSS